jgi:hypothetical protein
MPSLRTDLSGVKRMGGIAIQTGKLLHPHSHPHSGPGLGLVLTEPPLPPARGLVRACVRGSGDRACARASCVWKPRYLVFLHLQYFYIGVTPSLP